MTNLSLLSDHCPTCGRRTADPDESPLNLDDAWYCGDCDMYRIPLPGSDLEREMRDIVDLVQRTAPDAEADWHRSRFRVITGEAT